MTKYNYRKAVENDIWSTCWNADYDFGHFFSRKATKEEILECFENGYETDNYKALNEGTAVYYDVDESEAVEYLKGNFHLLELAMEKFDRSLGELDSYIECDALIRTYVLGEIKEAEVADYINHREEI